jgi:hypothetical protein
MNKEKEEKLAEISARITKVIGYLGETPNSFATKLGYPRAQTIYDIQKMKSAPSYDFFQRFSNAGFSAIIEIDWLLTGNGPMLKQNVSNDKNTDNTLVSSDKDTINNRTKQDETSYMYKMYQDEKSDWKEEKKELKEQINQLQSDLRQKSEELAALKAKYHQSQDKEPEFPPLAMPGTAEDFIENSYGDYGEGYPHTKEPTSSKKSLGGKI